MEKRLIPYSTHLPESVFNAIKQAAGERKAAGLIREAIVSFVEKRNHYDHGFSSGIEAAIKKVNSHKLIGKLSYDGQTISELISKELQSLIK